MKKLITFFMLVIPCLLYAGDIPENASLDYSGHDWVCNKGYYKAGQKCNEVKPPENASLDYLGHDWVCNKEYKKLNNKCVPMTSSEIQKQKALEQEIIKRIQVHQQLAAKGGDCETEYKTNAEVCVRISNLDFDCSKSYTGDYYRSCDVNLSYDLETNYSGGSYLDVDVECEVEIEYKGRNTYSSRTDSDNHSESHDLYANDFTNDSMDFDFSFSSYQEVYNVKVSSAKCKIENVDLF